MEGMDTSDIAAGAPATTPGTARRSWADISLGITTTEARQLSARLDTVFDALHGEAA